MHQAVEPATTDDAVPPHIATRVELFRLFRSEQLDPDTFYAKLADRTLARFDLPLRGKIVLDLGSGPGHYTAALQRAGAHVIALDLDRADVERVVGQGLNGVHGDAANLPFPDCSIDAVFSSNLLEHVPRTAPVFDEIERVLKPGGWAWVSWTNWYSPWGGHLITPFHYLGPKIGSRVHDAVKGPPERNQVFDGLWPAHVGPVLRDVSARRSLRLQSAAPRYYPSQRWILRVPGLRELVTWNCLLVLAKAEPITADPMADPRGRTARLTRRGLRWVRVKLSDRPLFLPVVLRLTPRGTTRRITAATDLVIEGYPRSSNTFAAAAIAVSSGGSLTVASHVHTPSQVIDAARKKVPTLMVVREPRATVRSLVMAAPHVPVDTAIAEWVHHHRVLWPYRGSFVVGTFEQITTDLPAVLRRVNRRFGIDLPMFEHTADAVAAVDLRMRADHDRFHPGDQLSAPWPIEQRREAAHRLDETFDDPRLAPAWAEAESWWQRYRDLAEGRSTAQAAD
jgi:SAM-dependent methyltransferase